MRGFHEIAGQVIMYLNVELELALVATQKCLNLLHDGLYPNSKKLWLINESYKYKSPLLLAAGVHVEKDIRRSLVGICRALEISAGIYYSWGILSLPHYP